MKRAKGAAPEPIAIIGIGCRFPGGADSPRRFWECLERGTDAITEVPADRWNNAAWHGTGPGKVVARTGGFVEGIDRFDADFFGISPREAAQVDPQQRLMLEVAWEALEDAGVVPARLAGSATGVFVGVSTADYRALQAADPAAIGPYSDLNSTAFMVANRLSHALDLRGASLALDTACASSLLAVHLACRSLRQGDCELALAGGVNALLAPPTSVSFSLAGMLSPDGRCKPFSAAANGYVRGEGAGAVLLKPLARALADGDRIYAVIRGSATNHGGHSPRGWMAPGEEAQAALIVAACADAGVPPTALAYVEAHGTGTTVGDGVEARALGRTVGRERAAPCVVGSVKSNIGHLEAGAGVAGLIKAALVLAHRRVPPTLHAEPANPDIDFAGLGLRVATANATLPEGPLLAGVNSFGIGGANVHVVLESAPPAPAPTAVPPRDELVALSAHAPEALRARLAACAELAGRADAPRLADFAHTARAHRTHHRVRAAFVVGSQEELRQQLAAPPARAPAASGPPPRLAFVYSGMGPQWWGMGRGLAETEPAFRAALEDFDAAWRALAGWSVLGELQANEADSRIGRDVQVSAAANVALQVALTDLWRAWGIRPDLVLGHSVGELVAAWAAGAIDLAQVARLTFDRNRCLALFAGGGRMAAVGLPEREVRARLANFGGAVSVAAVNGPTSTTISGDAPAVEALAAQLSAEGTFCRVLAVDTAFHSAGLAVHHAEFLARLPDLRAKEPVVPLISTVTGAAVTGAALGREHWIANLEQPVLFQAALERALDAGCRAFLEIGPHPVLRPAIAECLAARGVEATVLASLRRDVPARRGALAALGALYERGFDPDWESLAAPGARVTELPPYPWQRTRHWNEPERSRRQRLGPAAHPLLGRRQSLQLASGALVWQAEIEPERIAYLADHRIAGTPVFPGSGYLEMASAALGEAARGEATAARDYALQDVRFHAALELVPGRALHLQTTVSPAERRFAIHSRSGGEAEDWTLRASGRYALAGTPGRMGPEERAAVRARCPKHLGAEEEREREWAAGYRFGATFRLVEQVWIGEREILAEVRVGAAQRESLGSDPARLLLFDASTLAAGAAVRERHGSDLHLPVFVGEIALARAVPERFWVHARLRPVDATTHAYDICACDDAGTVLMTLGEFRTQAVATAPARQAPPSDTYEPRWHPAPAGAPDATQRTWMILADHGGLGVDVAAALTARGQRCQIVRRSSDLASILRAAGAERLEILHLWGLDATNERLGQALAGFAASGGYGIADLVRAAQGCQARMTVITRGAQSVGAGEGARGLQAAAWGLVRVTMREHPALACRLVDLPREPLAAEADRIAEELLGDSGEEEVALRAQGRLVLRLEPRAATDAPALPADGAVRIETGAQAGLEHLTLRPVRRRAPAAGEVEVRVAVAGLNYRDVMKALGIYPSDDPAREAALGDEAAGVVERVGPGVQGLVPGDEVVVSGTLGNLAAWVTVPALHARRKPARLTLEQAASVPNVFLTAHYALDHVARLARGERVLIHAAAGGVGLAAIQVARRAGAEIFCTAGSPAKREHLRSLGIAHVMDSRSLAFADEVMRDTGGEGVDVVLNSIAGEAVGRSLGVLRGGGRFLELGKTDVYRDTALGLRLLRDNLSFHVIDLGRLWATRPAWVAQRLDEVWQAFERGELEPLPLRVFPAAEAAGAFRHMAQARHIGKIALSFAAPASEATSATGDAFRADASYLVTGGLGGLGEALLPWMVSRGARQIAVMGRTPPDARRREMLARLEADGARIAFLRGDVALEDDVRRVLAEVRAKMPPLRGVIHAAGVLDDGLLAELTPERYARVMAPKVLGAHHLDRATAGEPLDFFVLFSSIAALYGSPGQANYAAANACLDALAEDRRARGLPAVALALGPVSGVGMGERTGTIERLANRGIGALAPARLVEILEEAITGGPARLAAVPLDPARFAAFHAEGGQRRCFAELFEAPATAAPGAVSFVATLRAAGEDEARALLEQRLAAQVARIAGLANGCSPQQSLKAAGFDSLMAVELDNAIWQELQVRLPPMFLLGGPSVAQVAGEVLRVLRQTREASAAR